MGRRGETEVVTVDEIKWTISDGKGNSIEQAKRLAYCPAWKTFSKLPEADKERQFNLMRGELIRCNLMEKE